VIGPGFAARGVAAKDAAENAIAAVAAIMDIVFMFRLLRTGRPCAQASAAHREIQLNKE
jgi:hypothetical protein